MSIVGKRTWSWGKRIVGGGLALIGLAGLPDDIATWAKWIDRMAYDPRVLELAEKAVEFSEVVNQWWIRGLLIVVGVSLAAWAWKPFWRLRHRWLFKWRRLVSEQVWITRDDALKLMKESPWGRLKEPNVVRSVSVFETMALGLTRERTIYGLSDTQKKLLKYEVFLDKTLDKFCETNPIACRLNEGISQVDETALRAFLRVAMDEEISEEFGDIPSHKVT
ncbi:hypothetical protein RHIZO_05170 [Rhizobiaceae bacterium]|nr:hypothetical protein RHIZO_05170 [Rhizobiaceae bacterium]